MVLGQRYRSCGLCRLVVVTTALAPLALHRVKTPRRRPVVVDTTVVVRSGATAGPVTASSCCRRTLIGCPGVGPVRAGGCQLGQGAREP